MKNVLKTGDPFYEYEPKTKDSQNLGYVSILFSCKERQKAVEVVDESKPELCTEGAKNIINAFLSNAVSNFKDFKEKIL
jgi:hypothetical protein